MIKNKKGSIVYISSSSALDGNEGRSAYSSTKSALIAQPNTLPLLDDIPDGISIDNTELLLLFINLIIFFNRPPIFLFKPIPNNASIIKELGIIFKKLILFT